MAVNNATGYNRTTNEPLDAIYLSSGSVYPSVAAANAAINIGVRYTGSFVNVQGNLYWYQNGVLDANLVPFIDTGSFNNSASFNAYTASVNTQLSNIYKSESNYTPTSSFQSYSASINAFTASVNTQLTNVYASQSNYMPVAGGTFTGPIVLSGDPTLSTQAATKNYVDQLINGLNWKHSVRAATTSSLATYSVDGTKTILTATSNGALIAQDAVSLIVADRLLVKNETGGNAPNNGIYQVTQTGSAAAPYILTRTTDANTSAELAGATAYVLSGSIEANRVYAINSSPITMGTTNIGFALVAGPSTYTNGSGITLTGNVFALDTAYTRGLLSTTSSTGITYNSSTGLFALSAIPNSSLTNSTISGISLGSNLTNITFNNSGTGATSGTTYNGGTAQTISYNTIGAQPLATNLTSLSGLTYVSLGFVKMSAAGTFSLDTNTYLTSGTGVTTFSAGTTGLTPSSATSGAITLAGTLNAANGGTGYTSISSLAGDAAFTGKYVDFTSTQTISGLKTFSNSRTNFGSGLDINIQNAGTGNNTLYNTNGFYNGTNFTYINTGLITAYQQLGGGHYWYSAPSGTAGGTVVLTQLMLLSATTGNLNVTGSVTGGSASFTTGSFSGQITANGTGIATGVLINNLGNTTGLQLNNNNQWNIAIGISSGGANDFAITRGSGYTSVLGFNSTGAATFASSVTGGAASFTTGAFSGAVTSSGSGAFTGNLGVNNGGTTIPLTVGVGNTWTTTAIAVINTANANKNGLVISNWIGSSTSYGPRIAFDNSTQGSWFIGSSDASNNFDIATTWGTPLLRIASTGAATFASSVTASSFSGSGSGLTGYASALTSYSATIGYSLSVTDGGTQRPTAVAYSARGASSNPNNYTYGMFWEFKSASVVSGTGNYAGLLTLAPWDSTTTSTGDPSYQLGFSPSGTDSVVGPGLKIRAGIDTTWGSWYPILTSYNYNTYCSFTTQVSSSGSSSGFTFNDRTTTSESWTMYADGGGYRIFSSFSSHVPFSINWSTDEADFLSTVKAQGSFITTNTEGLRLISGGAYLCGYDASNTTRTGYLQFNTGTNVTLSAEGSASTLLFNTNSTTALTINSLQQATFTSILNVGNGGTSTAELTIYGAGNSGRIVGYRNTLYLKNSQSSSNQSNAIVFGSSGTANSWTIMNDITADGTNINRLDFMLNGSTTMLLNSGGLYTPGYVSADGGFVSSHSEGLRLENSGGYIAGWNSANTARTGYLQFNTGTNVTLAAEAGANNTMIFNTNYITALTINGSQNVILSASSGIGSIYTIGSYKTFNIDGNAGGSGGLLSVSYNGTCYGQMYTNSGLGLTLSSTGTGSISNYAYNYYVYTNGILALTINSSQVITAANLAGTGSRAVLADASGNLSAPVSDSTVKKNIVNNKYGLSTIMKLRPVNFEYKDAYKNYGIGLQSGLIAQEVQKVIPEIVFKTPSTGKLGINYGTGQLESIEIKAIQELSKQVTDLQKQNAALEARLAKLESKK